MHYFNSPLDVGFIQREKEAQSVKETENSTLIVPVFEGNELGPNGQLIDTQHENFITANLKNFAQYDLFTSAKAEKTPHFEGKSEQVLVFAAPEESGYDSVVLFGMGQSHQFDLTAAHAAGAYLKTLMTKADLKNTVLLADSMEEDTAQAHNLYTALATTCYESFYCFDKYKSRKPESSEPRQMQILIEDAESASAQFSKANILSRSKMWAQDLTNEPANRLYPEKYARQIKDVLEPLGVKVTRINHTEMKEKGMYAALAVGQSSSQKPYMVVMEWDGANGKHDMPVGLVGKGVTMDTGGYNIKTGNMEIMKMDMGGSAAVVGCMKALAEQQSSSHVVAIVGLVENRITGDSYLPGDIIDSLSGQSIEIDNTDAEGRLVMADAMTYLQRRYFPHTFIDIATLTGACIKAHGHDKAALMSNDVKLSEEFQKAAESSREKIVVDTIEARHREAMMGINADLRNSGTLPEEGHITAGAFLENFVEGGRKWAHIDIAGPAIPLSNIASGYGVKLLAQWINDNYSLDRAEIRTSEPGPA